MASKLTTAQDKWIRATAEAEMAEENPEFTPTVNFAGLHTNTYKALRRLGLIHRLSFRLTDTGRAYATERGWLAPVVTETVEPAITWSPNVKAWEAMFRNHPLLQVENNMPTDPFSRFTPIPAAYKPQKTGTQNLDASDTIHSAAASSTPEAESAASVFAVGQAVRFRYGTLPLTVLSILPHKQYEVQYDDTDALTTCEEDEIVPKGATSEWGREGRDEMGFPLPTNATPTSDRAIEGAVVVEAVAERASMIGQPRPALLGQPEHYDDVDSLTILRDENANFVADIVRLEDELAVARSQVAALTGALETIANNLDEMAANPHKSGDHIRSWAETMLKIANKALG